MALTLTAWFQTWMNREDTKNPKRSFSAKPSSVMASFHMVGDFLERHNIDPNPTHFELVYRYQVSGETGLEHIVDRLIASGKINDDVPESQISKFDGELSEIADIAQTQLQAIELIVGKSNEDAKVFGTALEHQAEAADVDPVGDNFINSLVKLTRTMIDKTRAAEEELRSRKQTMDELQNSLADARLRADTDALTGLSNRRAFERELGAACERANSRGTPLSLAICDVDHFKSVNDRFGHVTGDKVLQLVGDILKTHCLPNGKIFRFGGEEFVVLCDEVPISDVKTMIDGARNDLVNRKIVKKETGESLGKISFSSGICDFRMAGSAQELLKLADKALYKAKANGRNMTLLVEAA